MILLREANRQACLHRGIMLFGTEKTEARGKALAALEQGAEEDASLLACGGDLRAPQKFAAVWLPDRCDISHRRSRAAFPFTASVGKCVSSQATERETVCDR